MYKIAIIGAGPAGMAAALQLKRCEVDFIWFEKKSIGGLLKNANCVDNYLGLPLIKGIELINCYNEHLKNYDIAPLFREVLCLDYDAVNKYFILQTNEKAYQAKSVIIASGTKPKLHPLINELPASLQLKCVYSIIPFLEQSSEMFCGKIFAIIGAGDAAFDFALSMASFNNAVHIFIRNRISAMPMLLKQVRNSKNIFCHEYTELKVITEQPNDFLKLTFEKFDLNVHYLIAAIGREPMKDFCSSSVLALEQELINKNLLFLIGDVRNGIYRQSSLAVGDGIAAAMSIVLNKGVM